MDASAGASPAPYSDGGAGEDDSDLLRLMTLCMSELNQRWANPLRAAAEYFPGKAGAVRRQRGAVSRRG